jgi:hypothetical protein
LLLLLVAGAIVNVAVAWGCGLWSGSQWARDLRFQPSDSEMSEFEILVQDEWLQTPPHGMVMRIVRQRNAAGWQCSRLEIFRIVPGVSGAVPDFSVYVVDAGWPMRSLSCKGYAIAEETLRAARDKAHWSLALEPPELLHAARMGLMGDEQFARPLPLRPSWPGFAINTALYAAILWLLFALGGTPFALRQWRRGRRIKRGLCPKCAYPVGTSDRCTECGAVVSLSLMGASERVGVREDAP